MVAVDGLTKLSKNCEPLKVMFAVGLEIKVVPLNTATPGPPPPPPPPETVVQDKFGLGDPSVVKTWPFDPVLLGKR